MHLISFRPFPQARFFYWNSDILNEFPLEGDVRIKFEGVKACVGYYDGKEHHPCVFSNLDKSQCPRCSFRDISKVYTRMDMKGYEHLQDEIINRPYKIYLAYFGSDVVKCGVTRSERILERMKEQAAIHFIDLMEFDNSKDAYSMEQLIQHTFGFKNAVRNSTKLKVLNKVNHSKLQTVLDELKDTEPFSDFLNSNLRVQKIDYNLPNNFELVTDSIDGKILGCRGSILFFENNNSNFAIDMRRKKGEYFTHLD